MRTGGGGEGGVPHLKRQVGALSPGRKAGPQGSLACRRHLLVRQVGEWGAGSWVGRQEAVLGGGSRERGVEAGGGDDPFPGHRGLRSRVCSRLGGKGGGEVRWAQAQREAGRGPSARGRGEHPPGKVPVAPTRPGGQAGGVDGSGLPAPGRL